MIGTASLSAPQRGFPLVLPVLLVAAVPLSFAASCSDSSTAGDAGADTDADSDSDADAGGDDDGGCLDLCAACEYEGTPCCGDMLCSASGVDVSIPHCEPPTFTDEELCAEGYGADGEPCAPLGLHCVYWDVDSDEDTDGTEVTCTCLGWAIAEID